MNVSLANLRAAAIEQDRCFSKTRLRDEFRMKPKSGAEPVAYYKNSYGGRYGVYKIADCVPLKQDQASRSAKQRVASRRLGIKARLASNLGRAGQRAAKWLEQGIYVLDTETTGLSDDDQIIEIAVCDSSGKVCFEQRISPSVPINSRAQEIHGISQSDLAECPEWPEVIDELQALLKNQAVVMYNSSFDLRMLRNTSQAFGLDNEWLSTLTTYCAMTLSVQAFGATNSYGTISLANAAAAAGVPWPGEAHAARIDALVTLNLVTALSNHYHQLHTQLKKTV